MRQIDLTMMRTIFEQAGIDETVTSMTHVTMPDYAVNLVALVNDDWVVRCSSINAEARFSRECDVLDQLSSLPFVPRVQLVGLVPGSEDTYVQIQSRVAGDTIYTLWPTASESLRIEWIEQLARAMHAVHQHRSTHYRIGVYQSALPDLFDCWLDGHDRYVETLFDAAFARSPATLERELFKRARRFYDDQRTALRYESGPSLGHGDLHLLNVMASSTEMTGIIDWEWSKPGGVEPESDLAGLIRWALYPADIGDDSASPPLAADMFECVIPTLLAAYPGLRSIPELATRMTIYQIEHELHQIVAWPPAIPRQPVTRLERWVDERVLQDLLP